MSAIKTADEIKTWLVRHIAGTLELPPDEIDPEATFDSLGLDSVAVVSVVGEFEHWLGAEVDPALPYEHPSIAKLSEAISRNLAGGSS